MSARRDNPLWREWRKQRGRCPPDVVEQVYIPLDTLTLQTISLHVAGGAGGRRRTVRRNEEVSRDTRAMLDEWVADEPLGIAWQLYPKTPTTTALCAWRRVCPTCGRPLDRHGHGVRLQVNGRPVVTRQRVVCDVCWRWRERPLTEMYRTRQHAEGWR